MKRTFTILVFLGLFCSSTVYTQSSQWLWAKSAGNSGYDYGNSVAADNAGNSYLTGSFNTSITFDPSHSFTSAGSSDIFLVKYDPEGTIIWAVSAGGSDAEIPMSVAVDKTGNVYVAGYFKSSSLVFGTTTLTNAGGNTYDLFLVKYDPSGTVLWAKSAGGTGDDRAYSVAVDTLGNSFLTGYFVSSTITFGTLPLNNTGALDLYLVKYDENGNALWANSASGTGFEYSYSVAVDKAGNSFITGSFNSNTLTFAPLMTISGPANTNIFVAKYSPAGLPLWAKQAGIVNDNIGYSVATDTTGNCFVAGSFKGSTLVFGTTTLTNKGHSDIFVVKYNGLGDPLWARSAGGSQEDAGKAVTTDKAGYCYLAGYFKSDSITIGTTVLNNNFASTADIVISEYSPSGDPVLVKSAGGTGDDDSYSIAVDTARNFFMSGFFSSPTLNFGATTLTSNGTTDVFIVKSTNVPVLGINDPAVQSSINIYPNPATDQITIPGLSGSAEIMICNVNGQVCKTISTNKEIVSINVAGLKSGIYFVRIRFNDKIMTGKFVK